MFWKYAAHRHGCSSVNLLHIFRTSFSRNTSRWLLLIGALKFLQNSQNCARVSFLIKLYAEACNFIEKETLTQVFSSEFWENFKNTSERLLLSCVKNIKYISWKYSLLNISAFFRLGVCPRHRTYTERT